MDEMAKRKDNEVISPLDFFDLEEKDGRPGSVPKMPAKDKSQRRQSRGLFITATDTGIGKTVATSVLGVLIKDKGLSVGVMKPVQCGGHDAQFLAKTLGLRDPLNEINPYCAREPLSPHLAFKRQRIQVDVNRIKAIYQSLRERYDFVLVEGAGGLMVPISEKYLMVDLIKDLGLDIVIVARLGLGTINHTLLTVKAAEDNGLTVKGVIFNELTEGGGKGTPAQTNPREIRQIAQVPVLGTIPYLKPVDEKEILKQCKRPIRLQLLLDARRPLNATQMIAWDKEYVWHPFTQMSDWLKEEPLVIDSASGSTLKDIRGRRYLDGISSLWVNVHGHRRRDIDNAIKKQINKVSHTTLLGAANTPSIRLAKKLVDLAPAGLSKVFYSDDGSTAVEVAVKMAYQYWQNTGETGKRTIAHLTHSYHGDTLGSVSVGGIDLFHRIFSGLTFKTAAVEFPDFYRAPEGKVYPAYTEECLEKMERLFAESGHEIAALVVEPVVQAAAGIIVWPEGVLSRVKELCKKYNILLIADEVATGFGRTGKMFACEHEKVSPDFLCLAKSLSGGYLPLAATLTTRQVFQGFLFPYKEQKTFFHGHTFTGNPLGCAAALANLEVFHKERTLARIQPKIGYLNRKLKDFAALKHVGDIRQKGLMAGIELVRDKEHKTSYSWDERMGVRVCREIRKAGVLLRPLGNVIVLMPPLSISKNEMDDLLQATYAGIKAVTEQKVMHRSRSRRRPRRGPRRVERK